MKNGGKPFDGKWQKLGIMGQVANNLTENGNNEDFWYTGKNWK